jgi:hypothetical protein
MTTMLPHRHKENLVNEIKPQFHSFGARSGKLRFAQMLDTERAAGRLNGFEPVTNLLKSPSCGRWSTPSYPGHESDEFPVFKLCDPRKKAISNHDQHFKNH